MLNHGPVFDCLLRYLPIISQMSLKRACGKYIKHPWKIYERLIRRCEDYLNNMNIDGKNVMTILNDFNANEVTFSGDMIARVLMGEYEVYSKIFRLEVHVVNEHMLTCNKLEHGIPVTDRLPLFFETLSKWVIYDKDTDDDQMYSTAVIPHGESWFSDDFIHSSTMFVNNFKFCQIVINKPSCFRRVLFSILRNRLSRNNIRISKPLDLLKRTICIKQNKLDELLKTYKAQSPMNYPFCYVFDRLGVYKELGYTLILKKPTTNARVERLKTEYMEFF